METQAVITAVDRCDPHMGVICHMHVSRDLRKAADGSLTIYVQADEPTDAVQRANWLPSPANAEFSLYVRAYWPDTAITSGQWTPPAVLKGR